MSEKNNDTLIFVLIAAIVVYFLMQAKKNANPAQITNNETITWTDYRGNQRTMTLSRDVHINNNEVDKAL
jgi:hypothetical protein